MYGGSFSEEQVYSAKSFLSALRDSHNCLREASRHRAEEEMYAQAAQKLLQAQKKGLVEFKDGHVVQGGAWKASDLSKLTANIRYHCELYRSTADKHLADFDRAQNYAAVKEALNKAVSGFN